MRITYDPEVDAMYIEFNDKQPDGARKVNDFLYIHSTENDEMVGLELFAVSQYGGSVEALAAQFERPLAEDEANVP